MTLLFAWLWQGVAIALAASLVLRALPAARRRHPPRDLVDRARRDPGAPLALRAR